MRLLHVLGRAALGVPFVVLGLDALREPGGRVDVAEAFGVPRPELVVPANGAAMVLGGAALAVGVLPRAAAAGLAVSLGVTTAAGHPYWRETDPDRRAQQRIQFLKNIGLVGGLAAYAATRAARSGSAT